MNRERPTPTTLVDHYSKMNNDGVSLPLRQWGREIQICYLKDHPISLPLRQWGGKIQIWCPNDPPIQIWCHNDHSISLPLRQWGDVSQLWICRPPAPWLLISVLWMMGSVVYSTGKIMKKFSDLYFSSYHRKLGYFSRKIKIKWPQLEKKIG